MKLKVADAEVEIDPTTDEGKAIMRSLGIDPATVEGMLDRNFGIGMEDVLAMDFPERPDGQ
jgi:uncharacterized protein (DUF433 family)